jgi:hypothetical protein
MKASQMQEVLERTAQMYREVGAADAAESLTALAGLFAGRGTFASAAKLIGKALPPPPAGDRR